MANKEVSHKATAETSSKKQSQNSKPEFQKGSPEESFYCLQNFPESATPSDVILLQRLAGNRAVSNYLQTRLTVGAADDPYEREADRIANQVMTEKHNLSKPPVQRQVEEEELQAKPLAASITPLIQRQEEEEEVQTKPAIQRQEEEEEIQTKPVVESVSPSLQRQEEEEELQTSSSNRSHRGAFDAGSSVENRLASERGVGSPLPGNVLEFMEDSFGADFGSVRIHDNQVSAQLNRDLAAQAFTHGSDVYMGEGKYSPGSQDGMHLIAHELTHVIQQTGSRGKVQRAGGLNELMKEKMKKRRQDMHLDEDDDGDSGGKRQSHIEQRKEEKKKELQQLSKKKFVSKALNPPTLTIMSLDEFKKQSYLTWKRRGKTIRAIDEALQAYHAYIEKAGGKLTIQNSGQAKAYLEDIIFDCEAWLEDHADDTSSSKKRMPAVAALKGQADAQIAALTGAFGTQLQEILDPDSKKDIKHTEGSKKVRLRMEGSAKSIFGRLGPIIDMAVPSNNTKCEIDAEIKIPLDQDAISFIGGHLNTGAERNESGAVKVRTELSITGGANIPGGFASIKGELGGYVEANAKTAEQAMTLVSFGFYRRFRESNLVRRGVTNFFWGGTQSQVGFKRSERWAAKVEKDIFGGEGGDDASVELGGFAAGSGELKIANVAKLGGGVKFTSGRKYTKETLEEGKKGYYNKQLGQALDMPTRRGAQKKLGQGTYALELGGSVEAGPFAVDSKLGVAYKRAVKDEDDKGIKKGEVIFDNCEYNIGGAFSIPVNELLAGGLLTTFSQAVIKAVQLFRVKADATNINKSTVAGTAMWGLEDVAYSAAQLGNLKEFGWDFIIPKDAPLIAGSVGLKVNLTAKKEADKPLTCMVSISYEKGGSLDLNWLSGKLKKSQRVVGLKWEKGQNWIPTKFQIV